MLQTNFLKTALASMLVVCAMGFTSCSSDEGEPETPPTESSIVGKWDVSDTKTRAGGDAKYGSFEFTADNKYIITQPAVATNGDKYMLVIFGDYDATGGENNEFTLNLKEFGIIKISITKNTASITIDGVVYVAVKADNVELTDKTKLLCGTWSIESEDAEGLIMSGVMTFTIAGTYLLESPSEDNPNIMEYDNGTWSWKSNNTLSVSYTGYWESYSSNPTTGETIKESGVTHGFDDWKIIKLTDKEFVAEFDDEGDIVTVKGTK